MAKKNPGCETGVCGQLGSWTHTLSNVETYRAQTLITMHHVRPELAVALSAFVFGGGAHG